jgi:hypothetical protein
MKRCGLDNGLQGRERLALDGERRGDAVLSGQRWGRRKRKTRGEKEEGVFAGLDDGEKGLMLGKVLLLDPRARNTVGALLVA